MTDARTAPQTADLGIWHTPLEPADRLGAAIGLEPGDLWIKRDDWLGLGGGGSKLRKLARLCAKARADGATTLVTGGAAQSNHARLTAAAARRLGFDVTLVLAAADHDRLGGNLALDGVFGADVVWTNGPLSGLAAELERVAAEIADRGGRPAVIPFGGSNVLGAAGYRECAKEILRDAPNVDHVVVPVGSGGTMAGLIAGLGAERVLGGHSGALADPRAAVAELCGELTGQDIAPDDLRLDEGVAGDGYERPTEASLRAMDLAAVNEALVLDPVYGAKAMAALVDAVASSAIATGDRVVFVATGGLPGLFGHAVADELAARTAHPRT
jgi:D-cysteine desulfhydrase